TFPRYSSRTIKATQFAKSRGASVVVMTDTAAAPVAEFADYLLLAHSDMASFVDSLVAPLSLLNAIIVAIGMRLPEEVSKAYEVLENIWSEQNVYEKHEDNKA
nr:SIS domain-containing protein [Synergistes sp.]